MTDLVVPNEDAQIALGRRLGPCLVAALGPPGGGSLVVLLKGDLGTGKTTLVRGILRGLGHEGSVRSPTYTLIEPYELPAARVFHLDLYRLGDPQELEYLGLRDLGGEDALLLVEWPERGAGALPTPDLVIDLAHLIGGRRLVLAPGSPRGDAVLGCLARLDEPPTRALPT